MELCTVVMSMALAQEAMYLFVSVICMEGNLAIDSVHHKFPMAQFTSTNHTLSIGVGTIS